MGAPFRQQQTIELNALCGPSDFVFIDILGPLPRINSGEQVMLIITDWYSKVSSAMQDTSIRSIQVANNL